MQELVLVPIMTSTMDITNERSSRLVVVKIVTSMSEEHAAIFRATYEDGRSLFLQNLDASIHGVKTIISQTEIHRLYGNPMSIAKSTKAHCWILLHPVQSIPRFHGVFLQQIMLILLFRVRLYLQNGLFL